MAVPTRLIKRRIKSIRSTSKIMKAMELVAGSKMRKTTQLTLNTRPYAANLKRMTEEVRGHLRDPRHPLLVGRARRPGQPLSTLLIIAASDRGLCGGFNSQILRKAQEFLRSRRDDTVQVITVGRRAEQQTRRLGYPLSAAFEAISNAPSFERAAPAARLTSDLFLAGTVDRVFVAYTHFKSALIQTPTIEQLLPMTPEQEIKPAVLVEDFFEISSAASDTDEIFEPSPEIVLDRLLPRLLEIQIYHALLESSASEHSARMMAMRSAGDAASDMLEDLTLTLNQARQGSITREISEISAGKAAIE